MWRRKGFEIPKTGRLCPVCRRHLDSFSTGPGGRPDARCGQCHSLERHRYLALLLAAFSKEIAASKYILEIAPSLSVTRMLREAGRGFYLGLDVDPAADGRKVHVVADLCAAPFPDAVFETSVCFHVFEHIQDDVTAMTEYARLISPAGIGFIQNPWRATGSTEEDPAASPEERIRRFGQADHVRMYGADFEDRLRSVGLQPRRILPELVLDSRAIDVMGITPDTPIWIVFGPQSRYSHLNDTRLIDGLRRRIDKVLARLTWSPMKAR